VESVLTLENHRIVFRFVITLFLEVLRHVALTAQAPLRNMSEDGECSSLRRTSLNRALRSLLKLTRYVSGLLRRAQLCGIRANSLKPRSRIDRNSRR
jgi:hypothetical protein